MRIAVTATGSDLESTVESRFGRCPYFIIIEPDTMHFEAVENPNIAAGGGAGIQSAQLMADKDVQTVLTGNCGPNAFRTFGAAGIEVIVGVDGVVKEAVEQFKAGAFSTASQPNVASHFGTRPDTDAPASSYGPGATPATMGQGRGGGMGRGGGRGMGRGMGRGIGDAGAGYGSNGSMWSQEGAAGTASPSRQQEPALLQGQTEELRRRLAEVNERIEHIQQAPAASKLLAFVENRKCTGCGACLAACPRSAITIVDSRAHIDGSLCDGCGRCVEVCPTKALVLGAR